MSGDLTDDLITLHEGVRRLPYQDSLGIWTIAKGHNMQANGLPLAVVNAIADRVGLPAPQVDPMPWPDCLTFLQRCGSMTDAEIDMLFDIDLKADCSWLWGKPWWGSIGEARQAAANDFSFNVGQRVAQEFTTFWGLYAAGDWEAAATDLGANPKLVAEEPKRIANLQQIIRTGSVEGIL